MYDNLDCHITHRDKACMEKALKMAKNAYQNNQVPVGAVVYDKKSDKIVGLGSNGGHRGGHRGEHRDELRGELRGEHGGNAEKNLAFGSGYFNSSEALCHAEIMAIDDALQTLERPRLDGCILYVTLEPCLMCLGAAINARIDEIIFGAYQKDTGALWSKPINQYFHHSPGFLGGVMEDECARILSRFFEKLR